MSASPFSGDGPIRKKSVVYRKSLPSVISEVAAVTHLSMLAGVRARLLLWLARTFPLLISSMYIPTLEASRPGNVIGTAPVIRSATIAIRQRSDVILFIIPYRSIVSPSSAAMITMLSCPSFFASASASARCCLVSG